MRILLLSSSAIILIFSPAAHAGERPLNPRIDTGFKLGTERGIVTTEIWVPVRQAPDRVLYGDARLTGDDRDNFEGNLGGGYRHIYGETVLGAHAWIDRRKTARGSTFNQATVGVEALGRDVDARLNAYVPLSGPKTYATPNMGRDAPYLAGSGVFYDTTGQLVEEPQGGFDIELGARLPVFEQRVDSIRVYGGFYHFGGDETPDITGWRTRVSADVTNWLQLGARFQKDSERGSQGFLEATLRFPGKASFRREGLRARLDESPERDIDIVTGAAITDSGIGKPVLDPTGNPQRVLHVDNTATGDGKGTNENPYATLKAAEAAMKPYDVIYVREGDGGTTGQDLGIVIDKPGVSLIGSGVDLVYEGGRVTGAAAGTSTGTVLAAATANPVITNTQASGNGVLVTADASLIAGLTAQGARRHGIRVESPTVTALTIDSVTALSNSASGIIVVSASGWHVGAITISRSSSINSTGHGITVQALGGTIGNINLNGNTVNGNTTYGLYALAQNGGQIDSVAMDENSANSNSLDGIRAEANGGFIENVDIINSISMGNRYNMLLFSQNNGHISHASIADAEILSANQYGFLVYALSGGDIDYINATGITATNNALEGVIFYANGAGSTINNLAVRDVLTTGNRHGTQLLSNVSGSINNATLRDVVSTGNTQIGVFLQSASNGVISASLERVTATGNASNGVFVDDDTTGAFTADLGGGTLGSTGGNRIYGNTGTDLRVDLDGGQLKAENNWWDNAAGLLPARVTLDAGGNTVDALPFLAADPGL